MNDKIYNLDESVVEYFEFSVGGHAYKFRHMTIEELESMTKVDSDYTKFIEYLNKFIEKKEPESPDFTDAAKKFTTQHWLAFRKMLDVEIRGDGSN